MIVKFSHTNQYAVATICSVMLIVVMGCNNRITSSIYASDLLKITEVAEGVYIHTSYLSTQDYGKVACNGMVVINDGIAIVCDTPSDEETSDELVQWISQDAKATISAVIVTHFHIDCLGGLSSFHNEGIPSYAQNHTIYLARTQRDVVPNHGFDQVLELPVGDATLLSQFHGAGHTLDNIVCYYEDQQVLFGGCLVKSVGASKGNMNDADVNAWSDTVREVKRTYPDTEIVIPGHGSYGNGALLDYTISLFQKSD